MELGSQDVVDAVGLYAVGSRDICDFIEMVSECNNKITIETLFQMLTTDSPNQTRDNKELNILLAPFVERKRKEMESS